ncbi:hypothetical protein TSUD_154160 [Trifolium subterraneum]|uniref:Uncharacterized protein n=1 Tax=Trifolium subterraneum TaxID=3900 RepID=A0A2Z6N1Y0_TRISU|nr:hypothetical protein TSUD_154160 [Trifolium subterraneum]
MGNARPRPLHTNDSKRIKVLGDRTMAPSKPFDLMQLISQFQFGIKYKSPAANRYPRLAVLKFCQESSTLFYSVYLFTTENHICTA